MSAMLIVPRVVGLTVVPVRDVRALAVPAVRANEQQNMYETETSAGNMTTNQLYPESKTKVPSDAMSVSPIHEVAP